MKINKNVDVKDVVKQSKLFIYQQYKKVKMQGFSSLKYDKEKKVKRKFKQSEKGLIMIVGSLVVGYGIYQLYLLPVSENYDAVSTKEIASKKRRDELEANITNIKAINTEVSMLEVQVNQFKDKYPNYRTENEILFVLDTLVSEQGAKLSTVKVKNSVAVTKSDIGTFISNKGIGSFMKNQDYFVSEKTDDSSSTKKNNKEEEAETVPATGFVYASVSFSVKELTLEQSINLMDNIYNSKRVMLPESLKMTVDKDGKASLDGELLFYAYRDKEIGNLF